MGNFSTKPNAEKLLLQGIIFDDETLFNKALRLNPDVNVVDSQAFNQPINSLAHSRDKSRAASLRGYTALMWAVQGYVSSMPDLLAKRERMIRALITAGANVNFMDANGRSILHFAVRFNAESIVDILLKAGADTNAVSRNGMTVMNHAEAPRRGFLPDGNGGGGYLSELISNQLIHKNKELLYVNLLNDSSRKAPDTIPKGPIYSDFFRSNLFDLHLINESFKFLEESDHEKEEKPAPRH